MLCARRQSLLEFCHKHALVVAASKTRRTGMLAPQLVTTGAGQHTSTAMIVTGFLAVSSSSESRTTGPDGGISGKKTTHSGPNDV